MRDSDVGLVKPTPLAKAIEDFHHARARASLQAITSRLRGESTDLLSFEDVANRLQVTGKASAGRRPIPVEAIIGSVGRYNDFTRTFLPLRSTDAQRWARVRSAGSLAKLPPIDVYQIGDAYFVMDGNHRVSIARQQGVTHIDAIVTLVQTRVPLSPHDDPDTLIVKSEHARFLAATRLDRLRPDADVRVSVAGQYAHLENLIEVHRYFLEEAAGEPLSDGEAVTRWYDESYLPTVQVIREQGILRYFPGRTEADLYVFIATHQAQLRKQMGWNVSPAVAAGNLLAVKPPRAPLMTRIGDGLRSRLRAIVQRPRASSAMPPPGSWSQQRVAARYSGQLFQDLLVPFQSIDADKHALAQALWLATREGAHLLGLHVCDAGAPPEPIADAFNEQTRDAGVDVQLASYSADWRTAVTERALLADIVVAASAPLIAAGTLHDVLSQIPRPLLLVPGQERPIQRLLLYYDGSDRAREALFAAAYMAEQWRADLAILLSGDESAPDDDLQTYLDFHDLSATFVAVEPGWQGLEGAAEKHDCDLLLLGYPGRDRPDNNQLEAFARLLQQCQRPLFVCT